MAANSKIEWCDHTFNPAVGCTKISPACDHCYAEGWAKRAGSPELWSGERRRTSAANWRQPIKWDREAAKAGVRAKVFCASLADVFDNQWEPEWRADLWALIRATPNLDWLLLTKRPQNIAKMLPADWGQGYPNVWLGTTVENQEEADRRLPHLMSIPAAIRFASCEPLLGPLDLYNGDPDPRLSGHQATQTFIGDWWEPGDPPRSPSRHGLDWIIAGGESGPGARPSHPDWFRSLRDQCAVAEVAFHFKQHGDWKGLDAPDDGWWPTDESTCIRLAPDGRRADGGWPMQRVGKKYAGRLLDGRTHDEFPASPNPKEDGHGR